MLGPAAVWRPLIIPTANELSEIGGSPTSLTEPSTIPNVETEPILSKPASVHQRDYTWSELMKRVSLWMFFNVNSAAVV